MMSNLDSELVGFKKESYEASKKFFGPKSKILVTSIAKSTLGAIGAAIGGGLASFFGAESLESCSAVLSSQLGKDVAGPIVDFADRQLSTKESIRISIAMSKGLQKVRQNLESGKLPNAGYVGKPGPGHSVLEEIFEGSLTKARNEYRAKKLPLYGNLFGNAAFFDCSSEIIHQFFQALEELTFRQICLIAIVRDSVRLGVQVRTSYYGDKDPERRAIYKELKGISGTKAFYREGFIDAIGSGYRTTILGTLFYDLLSLEEIATDDIEKITQQLRLRDMIEENASQ